MTYDAARLRRHFLHLRAASPISMVPVGRRPRARSVKRSQPPLPARCPTVAPAACPNVTPTTRSTPSARRMATCSVCRSAAPCSAAAPQLTYDFSRTLARTWKPGDEIVLSLLDHDCNVRPWVQAAERVGARMRWIDFDPATGEVDMDSVSDAIGERTRLVAITAASNLIGTKPPVREIADRAHAVGALTYIDGVHYTAHGLVDVRALGADFFVCSPYKFLRPHCAVLAGRLAASA